MEQSPKLALPYVMAQQSQKHVTVNEGLRRLDALVQLSVISKAISAQPDNPAEGDAYLLPADATGGQWSGHDEGVVAVFQDTSWLFYTPRDGWRAYIVDEGKLCVFAGGLWAPISSAGSNGQSSSRFGVNTDADDVNRLAVKSDAVLLSHDDVTPGSGDLRLIVNRDTPGDTAAVLFQTGFQGQVEFGLLGQDSFSAKVSSDGVNFAEAFRIDHQTAKVAIANLQIGHGAGLARIEFDTDDNAPFWGIGQGGDQSFFIQRLAGGFGSGGKVLIYNDAGALGLWGPPSSKGKIATRSNVNADGVDNILYLEQTALSVASGVAQFHNNTDNATPILRCTTNSKTVLHVPASGSIECGAALRLHTIAQSALSDAADAGAGAVVFVTDLNALVVSDGAQWRRVSDDSVV